MGNNGCSFGSGSVPHPCPTGETLSIARYRCEIPACSRSEVPWLGFVDRATSPAHGRRQLIDALRPTVSARILTNRSQQRRRRPRPRTAPRSAARRSMPVQELQRADPPSGRAAVATCHAVHRRPRRAGQRRSPSHRTPPAGHRRRAPRSSAGSPEARCRAVFAGPVSRRANGSGRFVCRQERIGQADLRPRKIVHARPMTSGHPLRLYP